MTTLGTRAGTKAVRVALAVTLIASVPGAVVGAAPASPVDAVNTVGGVALEGHDPVAYLTAGRPMPGVEEHTYRWKGATYRFASAENRARFMADPDQYLPQYGGYCAYAMSLNRIADIDPARWALVEGKLYLNNNRLAHGLWSLDRGGNIAAADRNWAVFPKAAERQ